VLRQKRKAVSPSKRSDNCNGDGGNLANRYQANRFQSLFQIKFKDGDMKDMTYERLSGRFSRQAPFPVCYP
jgi:hypothetical protein